MTFASLQRRNHAEELKDRNEQTELEHDGHDVRDERADKLRGQESRDNKRAAGHHVAEGANGKKVIHKFVSHQ